MNRRARGGQGGQVGGRSGRIGNNGEAHDGAGVTDEVCEGGWRAVGVVGADGPHGIVPGLVEWHPSSIVYGPPRSPARGHASAGATVPVDARP